MLDGDKRRLVFDAFECLREKIKEVLAVDVVSGRDFADALIECGVSAMPASDVEFSIHANQDVAIMHTIGFRKGFGCVGFRIPSNDVADAHERDALR